MSVYEQQRAIGRSIIESADAAEASENERRAALAQAIAGLTALASGAAPGPAPAPVPAEPVIHAGSGADILRGGAWAPEHSGRWFYSAGDGWSGGDFIEGNVAAPVLSGEDAVFSIVEGNPVRYGEAQFQRFFLDFDWRVTATVPAVPPGIVVAPLWGYDPDSPMKPEFDHEIFGGELHLTHHAKDREASRTFAAGPLSGRHEFGIRRAGARIEWLLDGTVIWTVADGDARPVKPIINLWMANANARWAGVPERPLAAPVEIIVHEWAISGTPA